MFNKFKKMFSKYKMVSNLHYSTIINKSTETVYVVLGNWLSVTTLYPETNPTQMLIEEAMTNNNIPDEVKELLSTCKHEVSPFHSLLEFNKPNQPEYSAVHYSVIALSFIQNRDKFKKTDWEELYKCIYMVQDELRLEDVANLMAVHRDDAYELGHLTKYIKSLSFKHWDTCKVHKNLLMYVMQQFKSVNLPDDMVNELLSSEEIIDTIITINGYYPNKKLRDVLLPQCTEKVLNYVITTLIEKGRSDIVLELLLGAKSEVLEKVSILNINEPLLNLRIAIAKKQSSLEMISNCNAEDLIDYAVLDDLIQHKDKLGTIEYLNKVGTMIDVVDDGVEMVVRTRDPELINLLQTSRMDVILYQLSTEKA